MRLDLSVLNEEQHAAVIAGEGPLLVLAGAGSGKTRVITYRIAHLIREGIAGNRILGITFTNRAAREMKERLMRMYPDLNPAPWLSTFHSLGYKILRIEHEALGFRKNFPIYDEADVRSLMTEILREFAGVGTAEQSQEDARRFISNWKSRFVAPDVAVDDAYDDVTYLYARAYSKYAERLQELNAVDFDDLIYRPVLLIEENEEVKDRWTTRFDQVLVDEYQDTNTAQYRFSRLLAGERRNLCVVGDDDQSIYAFRGAEVEKILSFQKDFPGASVVTLEANYRSVATILNAANAVIKNNPRRHDKTLRSVRGEGQPIPFLTLEDENAEAEEVVSRILNNKRAGLDYKEQAILLRSAILARPFEEKLRFYQIPYTIIGGRSFFDRREVRDVLAYLRLLADPEDDISVLRVLNSPRRGWGKGNREKLDSWAREQKIPILRALREVDSIPGVSSAARQGARSLINAIDLSQAALTSGAAQAARVLLEEIGFEMALREMTNDSVDLDVRRRAIGSFLDTLERYEARNGTGKLDEFLSGISLDSKEETQDSDSDVLTLLTFHGAKGLEFKSVYLVGIEEGLIPHKRAVKEDEDRGVEEERRLFYVAITRAKDHLVMTRSAIRRIYGRDAETEESRFTQEIPDELLNRKDVIRENEEAADEEQTADFLSQLRARFE